MGSSVQEHEFFFFDFSLGFDHIILELQLGSTMTVLAHFTE